MYNKKTSSNHLTSIQDRLSRMNLIKGIRISDSKKIKKSFYTFTDDSPGSFFFHLFKRVKRGLRTNVLFTYFCNFFFLETYFNIKNLD